MEPYEETHMLTDLGMKFSRPLSVALLHVVLVLRADMRGDLVPNKITSKQSRRSLHEFEHPELFSAANSLKDLSKKGELTSVEVTSIPRLSAKHISCFLV